MPNNLGNKQTMAKNIKYYMDRNGVSAADMCRVLNVPQSTFSYWLHAKSYPRIDKIEKMAHLFGIKKSDLVEERSSSQDEEDPARKDLHEKILKLFDSMSPDLQAIFVAQAEAAVDAQKARDSH